MRQTGRFPSTPLTLFRSVYGALLLVVLLGLASDVLLPRAAWAHRSFLNLSGEAGSGSLGQEFASGQYGFAPESPFYVGFEADHEVFYLQPDDNALRGLAYAGYESTHLGLSLRGGYLTGPFESLTMTQFGGTLFYRFVPWGGISDEEMLMLRREERKAIIERHKKETNEAIPNAPLFAFALDQYSVSSDLSKLAALNPLGISLWTRAVFQNFWTFVPTLTFFTYDTAPGDDPAGRRTYGSRALRLVRFGPDGAYSGIFGLPSDVEQIYSQIKLFPLLQLDFALTRASLNAPPLTGYSIWLGFDRFVSEDKRWAISPAYEQYFLEGQTFSFFSVSVRYGAASQYTPPPQR